MNTAINMPLKRLIEYAYQEVDYYRDIFDNNLIDKNAINTKDDLSKIPFLTKETVQKQSLRMISNEYKRYPKNQFIEIRRTSGSTGEYLKVYWDRRNDIQSMIPAWRIRKLFYSVEPSMKYCSFYTVNYRGNKIIKPDEQEMSSNERNLSFYKVGLTYERLKQCYDMILSFNPEWLNLQPSIAYLITQIIKEDNLRIPSNLKYIELSGELLLNEYRQAIREVFNIEPANEYGTSETNVIAIEHNDKKLHVLEENVIVEVIKDGKPVIGEEGEIYVTSLTNYAMPFIRYKTGDMGIMRRENSEDILDVISGRASDFIILENGERLNSYVLFGIIQYTNEYMSNAIKQFQIIQRAIDKFDVFLALKDEYKNWAPAVKQKFIENINEKRLQKANWDFHFVNNILPDAETGKTKYFKGLNTQLI
ncbi:MAG: hypothetical protein FWD71_08030 [Oscillospiraceae bacterium]|nr:hypothetical protein [Oscillospiraceae bacterium]